MKYTAFSLVPITLLATCAQILSQAPVSVWKINTTGTKGLSLDATMNAVVSQYDADVQSVYYTDSDVYVVATGIPSYPVGLFPDGNPSTPVDTMALWRIPRNPEPETGAKTALTIGSVGVHVNGVSFYDGGDTMSYNQAGIWNNNAIVVEGDGLDDAHGHPSPLNAGGGGVGGPPPGAGGPPPGAAGPVVQDTAADDGGISEGYYHHHHDPIFLRDQLGDDGSRHSPILGYAFDGYPLYGPYGYSDSSDSNSGIRLIKSSYQVRSLTQRNSLPDGTALGADQAGPDVSDEYPLGYFQEDFAYVAGSGDLNEYNMRFTVTPEYPDGTWAYYATIQENGEGAFPYFIGNSSYFGKVADDNLSNSVSLPDNAVKYEVSNGSAVIAGSSAISDGWYSSSWFGTYNANFAPWIFHDTLGWQYVDSSSLENSTWVWDTSHGWMWTSASDFPFFWKDSANTWFYYLEGSTQPRWFYNFSSSSWESE